MGSDKIKIVVTGASGLLGRAVVKEAEARGHTVIGTAFSRATAKLAKLDLSDASAVSSFLREHKPQAIIHCAAEKRPDVAEQNQAAVEQLNSQVPGRLAREADALGAYFVYVSTDYVFDGTRPPYKVNDTPNPLNFYGRTKLAGEQAVREASDRAAILRVPVLYGEAETPGESAVNMLVDLVRSSSGKVDALQPRFPTCTDDVAHVLVDMCEVSVGSAGEVISGVFHFSAKEEMTKYQMCQVFARILKIDDSGLVPITEKPQEPVATRPDNCQLSTEALEEVGISVHCVPFSEWWTKYLQA
ncbi:hypothetical protein LPJ58_001312 [Coemansia sp. RSA 1591]|nr:hypothetical protein LPJ54_007028 [Coemansia sp. RSA 1824]KAJ1761200.1 hypothetical protein LPJ58_001312 [Coemansia sp. RSA 1591]KAJ1765433.1 hypothetical protein LPJ69_001301 [Coemansia sp. RSA 1752]KAJ1793566.1 hypothetical protein LPJ67_001252 [Coemansia sp. RSA 1938]KAJ2253559.1 hypothetical protein GGH98_002614 [Coemansia sp. RSA 454]KAJ2550186.1 hypothetical protein IWW35_003411 [Coemansia sp. RSA 1878]